MKEYLAKLNETFYALAGEGAQDRSYPEEYNLGCYQNKCLRCGKAFLGNKGRATCKLCLRVVD